jgi:hypothetical protein
MDVARDLGHPARLPAERARYLIARMSPLLQQRGLVARGPALPNVRCSRRAMPSRWVVFVRVESPAAELGR